MGQKTNPIGFRLGVSKTWRSKWYAKKDFPALLQEDELLRKYLKARLSGAAISDITIERKPGKVVVTIHTGRPGVVIGKKGQAVEELEAEYDREPFEIGFNARYLIDVLNVISTDEIGSAVKSLKFWDLTALPTVPISPAFKPASGRSRASTTRSNSSIISWPTFSGSASPDAAAARHT